MYEAKDPLQQLTGKQKRIDRLKREHEEHMVDLRNTCQIIEDAQEREEEVRATIAAGLADIAKLEKEKEAVTRNLQTGAGGSEPPLDLDGAWTLVQRTLIDVFDGPAVSQELQNHRAPMEEAFLALTAVLKATQQRPPPPALPPALDAATTEQQQQQQAVLQQQQLQQVAANTALPGEGAAVGTAEGDHSAGGGAAAGSADATQASPTTKGRSKGKKTADTSDAELLAQPSNRVAKEARTGPY